MDIFNPALWNPPAPAGGGMRGGTAGGRVIEGASGSCRRGSTVAVIEENIAVTGMRCMSCAYAIEKRLRNKEGVSAVRVSVDKGNVRVTYDPRLISRSDIESSIEDIGYTVTR